jgi:PD-(D/E)XK endonuclease
VTVATPTEIGARAEAAVASALVRTGKPVFLPAFGVNSRIDLIYERDGDLVRVQCKTSRVVGEVLVFRTCSNTKNMPRDYAGEVDVFGVYSPAQNLVYLVPVAGSPKGVLLAASRARPQRPAQARVVGRRLPARPALVRPCTVEGCEKPRRAHGLCRQHLYSRRGV